MSLLVTAFKLALKAKMLKDGIAIVNDVVPTPVKKEILKKAGQLTTQIQDGAADLLAQHAPEFSKKIARKAEPVKAKQEDTLTDIQGQLAQLTEALQKAQNTPAAATKKRARKPSNAA